VQKSTQRSTRLPQSLVVAWRVFSLLAVLYLFFVSIGLMGAAFKLFGKDFARGLFALTSNPFNGLFVGILTTAIIQSSSTTTSMVVGMVGARALTLPLAIPIIMGANIGTSVTNAIVSLGHITRSNEFRRAFGASIVHDFFNLIAVTIFFPLEYFFHFIEKSARLMGEMFATAGGARMMDPLKMSTKPLIHLIVEWSRQNPWITLAVALLLLFLMLRQLTTILRRLIIGRVEIWFQKTLFKNPYRSLALGLVLTMLVQSSSITTSLIVPIAASGILTLPQILPYTLGANIGTTVAAIMAALATGEITAIMTGFAHLLFNIFGVIIIWPFRWLPVFLAERMSELSMRNRALPIAFIIVTFFVIPGGFIYFMR